MALVTVSSPRFCLQGKSRQWEEVGEWWATGLGWWGQRQLDVGSKVEWVPFFYDRHHRPVFASCWVLWI
jgi:hypothetical protein